MSKWVLLAVAIVCEVFGTMSLRAAMERPGWFVGVALGYLVAFGALAAVLRTGAPIGVVYGVWAASGIALTAVLATLLFDDAFTWVMGLGIILVSIGVTIVEVGSQRANQAALATEDAS